MKKALLLIMLVLTTILAATDIPAGPVSGVWTSTNNPYNVQGNITIAASTTLTIEAGVLVNFTGSYVLTVNGRLVVNGDEGNPVTFSADNSVSGWKGISFINTIDNGMNNSIIDYSIFNDGNAFSEGNVYFEKTGGAIRCTASVIEINNCVFSGNIASVDGGAIALHEGSDIMISNSSFTNNQAGIFGGAIYIEASAPYIENCIVKSNQNDAMGAICAYMDSSPTIVNTEISNNLAGASAGFYVTFGEAYLYNVLFFNNETETGLGGAIGCVGSQLQIFNCTIVDNTSVMGGGAIWAISASDIEIINTISWNNQPDEFNLGDADLDISYSDVMGTVYEGVMNFSLDPEFANPAEYNYRLTSGSICIDNGTPDAASLPIPATDLDGNSRINDGNFDGTATIDMGCYEFFMILDPPANLTATVNTNDVTLTWENPVSEDFTSIYLYRNDVLFCQLDSETETFTDMDLSEGTYTYYATAYYNGYESGPSNEIIVVVGQEEFLPPENLTYTLEGNVLTLYWDSPMSANLLGFKLYINGYLFIDNIQNSPFSIELALYGTYEIYLTAVYENGESEPSNTIIINYTTVNDVVSSLDENVKIYPNPFNPVTSIDFNILKENEEVSLNIYNIRGQRVKTILNNTLGKGLHSYKWNGTDQNNRQVSAGVFLYELRRGNLLSTGKLILLK